MTTAIALETSKGDLPLALGARPRADRHRAAAQRRRTCDPRMGARTIWVSAASVGLPIALTGVTVQRGERRAPAQRRPRRRARRAHRRPRAPTARARARCCACCTACSRRPQERSRWGGSPSAAAQPGDGLPAAGAAAALGCCQRRLCAAPRRRCAAPSADCAYVARCRPRASAQWRDDPRADCPAASSSGLRSPARAALAARSAVPRRADREPRPGGQPRDRGARARHPRRRHDHRDVDAQPRPGATPRRAHRVPARRPRD